MRRRAALSCRGGEVDQPLLQVFLELPDGVQTDRFMAMPALQLWRLSQNQPHRMDSYE